MADSIKERIYKFDNVKFLAIMLVVIGHCIGPCYDDSDIFRSGFVFIYSFHMPLFIFISGLFVKEYKQGDKFPMQKIAYYLVLGFALALGGVLGKKFIGRFAVEFHTVKALHGGFLDDGLTFLRGDGAYAAFRGQNKRPFHHSGRTLAVKERD